MREIGRLGGKASGARRFKKLDLVSRHLRATIAARARSSAVTSKPASCGHFKTGQLTSYQDKYCYTLPAGISASIFDDPDICRVRCSRMDVH